MSVIMSVIHSFCGDVKDIAERRRNIESFFKALKCPVSLVGYTYYICIWVGGSYRVLNLVTKTSIIEVISS